MRDNYVRLAAIVGVVGLVAVPPAESQSAENGSAAERQRVRVTVALVDELPDTSVGAVIVRRANAPARDIILMTRNSASARQLSAALAALLVTWEAQGRTPTQDGMVRVSARRGPAAWFNSEERRAEAVVRRLRQVSPRQVEMLGRVQAVEMRVKPVRLTRRAP